MPRDGPIDGLPLTDKGDDRQEPALADPPDDLTGFPEASVAGEWFRAHSAGLGPWWFASSGDGRFDLAAPKGTCYVASCAEAAIRERWGKKLVRAGRVSAADADTTVVSRLACTGNAADTTAQSATRFGITRELGTITPYTVPQKWATALSDGHAALLYWPRFSTGADMYALALFGRAGANTQRPVDSTPLGGRAAARAAGIQVIGRPRSLPTVDPPSR